MRNVRFPEWFLKTKDYKRIGEEKIEVERHEYEKIKNKLNLSNNISFDQYTNLKISERIQDKIRPYYENQDRKTATTFINKVEKKYSTPEAAQEIDIITLEAYWLLKLELKKNSYPSKRVPDSLASAILKSMILPNTSIRELEELDLLRLPEDYYSVVDKLIFGRFSNEMVYKLTHKTLTFHNSKTHGYTMAYPYNYLVNWFSKGLIHPKPYMKPLSSWFNEIDSYIENITSKNPSRHHHAGGHDDIKGLIMILQALRTYPNEYAILSTIYDKSVSRLNLLEFKSFIQTYGTPNGFNPIPLSNGRIMTPVRKLFSWSLK